MENDSIVTPNVIRPPLNIPRRSVNYIPNPGGGEGNGEGGGRATAVTVGPTATSVNLLGNIGNYYYL